MTTNALRAVAVKIKVSQSTLCEYSKLCLKIPEKMQKARNESDQPGLRTRPKTGKNGQF